MAEQIERLVTVWDAQFDKLDEKLDKIRRSHFKATSIIKKDADNLAARLERNYGAVGKAMGNVFDDSRLAVLNTGTSRLSVFGSALEPLGPAGMAAAAGVAALAVAATQAVAAMRFADEIDDAAQKLNIGTDALQEYRFAMTEVGGTAQDADKALEGFSKALGSAQSGLSPRAMKPFAALGFTREDLDKFNSGEEALAEVSRRVAELGKESERAAVVEKLGLGPMLPLLREGAERMEELRQKAQDLGYVMDAELVEKGAVANQQFETMAHIIDVQMKSAFVGLADEVLTVTSALADALSALNDFIERFDDWKVKANAMYGDDFTTELFSGNSGQALWSAGRATFSGRAGRAGSLWSDGADRLAGNTVDRQGLADLANGTGRHRAGGAGGTDRLNEPPGRQSNGGRDRAAREAEQRAQRAERADDAIARLDREVNRAMYIDFGQTGIAGNASIARANIAEELAEKLKAIDRDAAEYLRTNGLRGLSETEAEMMRVRERELADLLTQAETTKEGLAFSRYRLEQEEASVEALNEHLDLTSQMMRSETDRVAVQRRILMAEQEIERKRLAQSLALDGNLTEDERRQKLDEFDRNAGARVQVFDHRETERLRDTFKSYGRDLIEAAKSGNLGEYIANQLQQRLMDMALDGLFNMLGGNEQGGGIVGTLLKSIPGFATGTASAPGGLAFVHGGEVLANLKPGTSVIPAHAVRAMGALQGGVPMGPGAGPSRFDININLDGANGDQAIRDIAYRAAAEGSAAAVRQATAIARKSAPGLQARMARLGTT